MKIKGKFKIKQGIKFLFLSIAFILVLFCCYFYIFNYTMFIENVSDLIGQKTHEISILIIFVWWLGVFIFILSVILGLKDVVKFSIFLIWEIFLMFASALLLIALFYPPLKFSFRILFGLSALIIVYTVEISKESFDKGWNFYKKAFIKFVKKLKK